MAKPMSTPITLASTKPLKSRLPSTDQSASAPVAIPRRVPRTAMRAARTMTAKERAKPARNLATTTRDRRGSSVKVTRPLRWLASLVTSMMMRIGMK